MNKKKKKEILVKWGTKMRIWKNKYAGNPQPKREYEKNKYEENPELKREYEIKKQIWGKSWIKLKIQKKKEENPEPKREYERKKCQENP